MASQKLLIVILGPTGVGKTDLSIEVARHFNTSILSCDSRQIYREMTIGTAVPSPEQLAAVPHHFVQTVPVAQYYNCWQFEQEALQLLEMLFESHDVVVMSGGSMMYIDAICYGIDEIPDIDPTIREMVNQRFEEEGLESVRLWLKQLDPEFYRQVDLKNHKRVIHAVEVCLTTGKPYSSLRTGTRKSRPFEVIKIGLFRERDELNERINRRTLQMMENGWEEEARALYPLRHLNALNTVGYKELFDYFDGKTDREEAIRLIQRNTRRYAKKQLTWFKRDTSIRWFHPDEEEEIKKYLLFS